MYECSLHLMGRLARDKHSSLLYVMKKMKCCEYGHRPLVPYPLYDNEYSSVIHIYFYETFSTQSSRACALKHFLDTLSDVLDKSLRFSLIKIESVSLTQAKPRLVPSSHLLYILFY